MCQFQRLDEEALKVELKKIYNFSGNCNVSLLKFSENLTYLIEGIPNDNNINLKASVLSEEEKNYRYVLRVFRPGYHAVQEMMGEVLWIHEIRKTTDIHTADIIQDNRGRFISEICISGRKYNVALFEFLMGSNIRDVFGRELYQYMECLGEIMAKLHKQVEHWEQAKSLIRFRWDLEDLVGPDARWGDFSLMNGIPENYMNTYKKAVGVIEKRLNQYGKSQERYGLIHSDLNINNILVDKGHEPVLINILDFDDCGYGWFLYDFSSAVLEYFDDTLEESLKALLRGYVRFRELSREDYEEIDTFILLHKIVRMGWIATHSDNDTVKKVSEDYYKKTYLYALDYCEKNRELLGKED